MSIHLRNEKTSSLLKIGSIPAPVSGNELDPSLKILLKTFLCYLHKFNFDHRENYMVLSMEPNHVDWNFIVL